MRRVAAFGHRIEDIESPVQVIAKFKNSGLVTASVAIVWCGPHSDQVLVAVPVFEAFIDKLMGSAN